MEKQPRNAAIKVLKDGIKIMEHDFYNNGIYEGTVTYYYCKDDRILKHVVTTNWSRQPDVICVDLYNASEGDNWLNYFINTHLDWMGHDDEYMHIKHMLDYAKKSVNTNKGWDSLKTDLQKLISTEM